MSRTLPTPWKPTKAQLLAAHNKRVPDLVTKNLIVLFAGINPGLYTAAIGRHFGRPGNRFWPALQDGNRPDDAPWQLYALPVAWTIVALLGLLEMNQMHRDRSLKRTGRTKPGS